MFRRFGVSQFIFVCFSSLGLAACGGGGGGGGSSTPSISLSNIPSPTTTLSSALTTGSASSNPTASYGAATVSLDAYTTSTGRSVASSPSVTRWDNSHLTDTSATTAWAAGWTGSGTTIAVIDDFSNTDTYYHYFNNIQRQWEHRDWFNVLQGTSTHEVDYRIGMSFTHGALVSNIAGGDANRSAVAITEGWTAINNDQISCSGSCSNYGPYYSSYFSDSSASVSVVPMAGVAKEATIVNNHVDLSGRTTITQTLNAIQSHIDNSRTFDAINLSLGSYVQTSDVTFDAIASDAINNNTIEYTSDAVIVTALGNSGAACTKANLAGCNAIAIAISVIPELKESSIFAGALTGSGSSETIATYSTRPGILKERSLLAQGHQGYLYDSSIDIAEGTSFAAPRISGAAAILRHKFPNLSGKQAANILLLTADKDINNDGIDDFTGASETYGQGKLDLISALSPVGSLAIQ